MVYLVDEGFYRLTNDEIERLGKISSMQPEGFEEMLFDDISRWGIFIGELESGYPHETLEYIDDLGFRNHLQGKYNPPFEFLWEKIKPEIDRLDKRFTELTFEIDNNIYKYEVDITDLNLYFRKPINISSTVRKSFGEFF